MDLSESVNKGSLHLKSLPAFIFVQHETSDILFRGLPTLIHFEQENLKQDYGLTAYPFTNIAQHPCSFNNLPFLFVAGYDDRKPYLQMIQVT